MLKSSVSASLFKENENRKKRPIFFVSKSLSEVETQYTCLEQPTLALCVATKKLRPYFQAHPIVILTNLPLRSTIHKPDLSRRMARWEIELSELCIQYKPRLALKGQVLADFFSIITPAGCELGRRWLVGSQCGRRFSPNRSWSRLAT